MTRQSIDFSYNEKVKDIFAKAKEVRESNAQNTVAISATPATQVRTITPGKNVGLGGIKLKEDGTITKTAYLDLLNIQSDKYDHLEFSDDEILKISGQLRRYTTGINASVPLICSGDICAFKSNCPYHQIGKAPVGQDCLLEAQLIHYWTEQYLNEFDVDPASVTEMHMVSELAEFNIYEMRITKYLAEHHPTLMQDVVTGIDANGNVLQNQEISRAFDLKERIKKNRMKVLESLMATRKDKVKIIAAISEKDNSLSRLADLKTKIDDIASKMKQSKIIDGESRSI